MWRIGTMKIKEFLQHRHGFGLTRAQTATAVGVSTGTVSHILERASVAGLSWPLPDGLDDEALRARLYGKVEPAPGVFHPGCAKGADIDCKLSRVPNRLVGPFGAPARRGLVVDDDPSGGGLDQEVDPSVQNLAVFLARLDGMLDPQATRIIAGVEYCPQAPCTGAASAHTARSRARTPRWTPPTGLGIGSIRTGVMRDSNRLRTPWSN